MSRTATAPGVILGLLCSFGATADDPIEKTLSARWTTAYNSGDAKALSAIYATDAQLHHGHCPPVMGRDEIEAFWRDDLGENTVQTHLEVVDSFAVDDLVYTRGLYAVEISGSADEPVGGTYTQIWRRQGRSEWVIYRESWNNLACVKITPRPETDADETRKNQDLTL